LNKFLKQPLCRLQDHICVQNDSTIQRTPITYGPLSITIFVTTYSRQNRENIQFNRGVEVSADFLNNHPIASAPDKTWIKKDQSKATGKTISALTPAKLVFSFNILEGALSSPLSGQTAFKGVYGALTFYPSSYVEEQTHAPKMGCNRTL